MAPHSSTLAWKIPWTEEPGGLQSMGSLRVGHDWATSLSRIGEGNGNPLQCSCLENPRDGGAWWAAVYGVAQSRTQLKWVSSSSSSIDQCFRSDQSLSRVRLFATPWITARQASLSITNARSSLRLTSIESVMPSRHLILCHPLLLLPSIPPSISLFQWVNSSHEVAKVLEFQLQHYSFQRNPRADLLQNGLVGSPCSLRDSQESSPTHSSKASILRHSTFFTVQLSHPYMTTGMFATF